MTLVDTSVWVDHLRRGDANLSAMLEDGGVLTHEFVIGELACGNIKRRSEIVGYLRALPIISIAEDHEVHEFVTERKLYGSGIGWIDAHLLAAALLAEARIWTRDRQMRSAAIACGLEYIVS